MNGIKKLFDNIGEEFKIGITTMDDGVKYVSIEIDVWLFAETKLDYLETSFKRLKKHTEMINKNKKFIITI